MTDQIATDMAELRETEIAWLTGVLSESIASLGYPVGLGVAPKPEHARKAAAALFDRYSGMIEAARRAGSAT